MAKIPETVIQPALAGLERSSSGKVRDVYSLPGHPDCLFPVVTDRISIFDFVLTFLVPQKGEVLNALNIFWRTQVIQNFCEHDLLAFGADIDKYLPAKLCGNPDWHKRGAVIKRLEITPIEGIVRGYLSGHGWKSYQQTGAVAGHKLPAGLKEGSPLPFPLYTPSTKAENGHDLYLTADEVALKYGFSYERRALQLYQLGRSYALQRGIILADTKFEGNEHVIADEMFTPDSSRYWEKAAWEKALALGKLPPSLDKEFVRLWGRGVGIDQMDPENPEHLAAVDKLVAPENVIRMTTRIYRYIFWRLAGMKLEAFQKQHMKVAVNLPRIKVDVVLGSRSDLEQSRGALEEFKRKGIDHRVHIISAHRNPEELRLYAQNLNPGDADVIVAGAGLAAQLPGVLKAWLCHYHKSEIPVIGVAMKGDPAEAGVAAKLSIEWLPGQPVELDRYGKAYYGSPGMLEACRAAVDHEFLPRTMEIKPAEFDVR